IERFGYLHLKTFVLIDAAEPALPPFRPSPNHCATSWRKFMTGSRLVRVKGLEPSRLSSRDPKSRVSTNSTTPASQRAFNRRKRVVLYHRAVAVQREIAVKSG